MSEFDAYHETYEAMIADVIGYTRKPHDFFIKVKADCLIDLFTRAFGPAAPVSVLDVGCGSGRIHRFMLDRNPRLQITGIDPSAGFIERARTAQPQVRYDLGDGRKLPYAAGTFDAACAICALHHVPPPQWQQFIGEMRRVVRRGGVVAVIEHNPFNPLTRRVVSSCAFDRGAVLLRCSQLAQTMHRGGLASIEHQFILFTPFENDLLRRFDRWLGWLPLGAQYLIAGRVAD